jgi:predicted small lipoprotein YifL
LHIGIPKIASILFLAAIAPSLAACGRRGPLELPPGAQVSCAPVTGTPGDYQSAANAGELSGAGESQSQAPKTCASKTPRPFFLDPLL